MSFVLSGNSAPRRELLEPDNYVARCYSMIILGTTYNEMFNTSSTKVLIQWELPDCLIEVERDGMKKMLPRAQSATYTLSLNEKATLRKVLESWRGKAFTVEELEGFDISKVVGAPCLLNVIQAENKKGELFNKISTVSKLPRGLACPPQVNPTTLFDITDPAQDLADMEKLPEWIRETIKKSDEYRARTTSSNGVTEYDDEGVAYPSDQDLPF